MTIFHSSQYLPVKYNFDIFFQLDIFTHDIEIWFLEKKIRFKMLSKNAIIDEIACFPSEITEN